MTFWGGIFQIKKQVSGKSDFPLTHDMKSIRRALL